MFKSQVQMGHRILQVEIYWLYLGMLLKIEKSTSLEIISLYSELYFLILPGDCGNLFFKDNIFKDFQYLFFYPKTSNFPNSGAAVRKKLPDSLVNNIFDVLLISLLYTL